MSAARVLIAPLLLWAAAASDVAHTHKDTIVAKARDGLSSVIEEKNAKIKSLHELLADHHAEMADLQEQNANLQKELAHKKSTANDMLRTRKSMKKHSHTDQVVVLAGGEVVARPASAHQAEAYRDRQDVEEATQYTQLHAGNPVAGDCKLVPGDGEAQIFRAPQRCQCAPLELSGWPDTTTQLMYDEAIRWCSESESCKAYMIRSEWFTKTYHNGIYLIVDDEEITNQTTGNTKCKEIQDTVNVAMDAACRAEEWVCGENADGSPQPCRCGVQHIMRTCSLGSLGQTGELTVAASDNWAGCWQKGTITTTTTTTTTAAPAAAVATATYTQKGPGGHGFLGPCKMAGSSGSGNGDYPQRCICSARGIYRSRMPAQENGGSVDVAASSPMMHDRGTYPMENDEIAFLEAAINVCSAKSWCKAYSPITTQVGIDFFVAGEEWVGLTPLQGRQKCTGEIRAEINVAAYGAEWQTTDWGGYTRANPVHPGVASCNFYQGGNVNEETHDLSDSDIELNDANYWRGWNRMAGCWMKD